MIKRYGIASTNHGTFFYAMVGKTVKGWRIYRLREWNYQSFLYNYMLLHKPVSFSLPAFWTTVVPSDTTDMITTVSGDHQYIATNQAEYDLYSTILEHNISGIFPNDVVMATLPRFFVTNPPPSFITLFYDNPGVKIGVIIDNELITVYSSIISSDAELNGFIGRIERSWKLEYPLVTFPINRFCINTLPFSIADSFAIQQVDCGTTNPDAIKAVGCALCCPEISVPQFDRQVIEKKPGILRTVVLSIGCIILLLTILASTGIFLSTRYYSNKLNTVKKYHQNILNNNNEIRQLIAEGDVLAKKVLHQNDRLSHPTTWSRFLHFLGKTRKEGLYFERLGTEPLKNDTSKIRVALAGWCTNETIVTEFIKTLSTSSLLEDVTLSSIERMPKQETLCKFKIICILSLFKK